MSFHAVIKNIFNINQHVFPQLNYKTFSLHNWDLYKRNIISEWESLCGTRSLSDTISSAFKRTKKYWPVHLKRFWHYASLHFFFIFNHFYRPWKFKSHFLPLIFMSDFKVWNNTFDTLHHISHIVKSWIAINRRYIISFLSANK